MAIQPKEWIVVLAVAVPSLYDLADKDGMVACFVYSDDAAVQVGGAVIENRCSGNRPVKRNIDERISWCIDLVREAFGKILLILAEDIERIMSCT